MSENHETTTYRDWVITKRQLGLLLVVVGVVGLVGILGLDLIRGGAQDFGPTQQLGVVGGVLFIVVGLTLLPLGDKPA